MSVWVWVCVWVYITHCGIFWLLVSYSFRLFVFEDSIKHNLMTWKQQIKEISKWNTAVISCASKVYEQ